MRWKSIETIFENLKANLMDLYEGDKDVIELLIDVWFSRCKLADRDHWKDSRIYAHVGCEDMRICVSSSIELLDRENLQGIFAHEIGHMIHIQIPEILENVLDEEELDMIERFDDDEIIADYVIERLFDLHIFYNDKKVQWLSLEKRERNVH